MSFDAQTLRQVDYGFFGPGSPSWKVWASPTSIIGFQRAVVLEHFDPFLAAAVADMAGIYTDPAGRLDRTLSYFLLVALGDSRTAIRASEHLMTVHAKATGTEPISGKRYSANNPAAQLWIHVTGWHSVLKAYEMFGPGPLPPEEEAQYWRECVIAAELQTCKPASVPTTRADVRAYFAQVRPQLCTSERADEAMHYLLRSPRRIGLRYWAISRLGAPATIATLPRWMRQLGRFDQPRIVDRAIIPLARLVAWSATARNGALLNMFGPIAAPMTVQILQQHRTAGLPAAPVTVTPGAARTQYGSRGTESTVTAS